MSTGSPDPPGQAIAVSAGTDSVLFQASVSAPPNGKWLTVSPTGGATPARITASVVSKDLVPGVYSGAITMTVAGAVNSSKVVPVTLSCRPRCRAPRSRPMEWWQCRRAGHCDCARHLGVHLRFRPCPRHPPLAGQRFCKRCLAGFARWRQRFHQRETGGRGVHQSRADQRIGSR